MAAAASFPFITCEVVVGLLGRLNSKERTGACSSDFGKLNAESLGRREQSTNVFEVKAFWLAMRALGTKKDTVLVGTSAGLIYRPVPGIKTGINNGIKDPTRLV
jgi:hypothetical protein